MSIKTQTTSKTRRITLDLPLSLHTQAKTQASKENITLKDLFIELLQKSQVESKKIKKKPRPEPLHLNLKNKDLGKLIQEVWLPKF